MKPEYFSDFLIKAGRNIRNQQVYCLLLFNILNLNSTSGRTTVYADAFFYDPQ